MNETYFLGANSENGFYSLYDGFAPGAFLHIIKGGPGCGKSGFMKKIADAAEKRGMSVHRVLCSGDPDSLDGVYIPKLGQAWMDGTSPHAKEPNVCGIDSDYIYLGGFLRPDFTDDEKSYVNSLSTGYGKCYAETVNLISSASSLMKAVAPGRLKSSVKSDITTNIEEFMNRHGGKYEISSAVIEKRFLSCASCYGDYRLNSEITVLCKHICSFGNCAPYDSVFLEIAAECAGKRGGRIILCPSPTCPEKLTAVLLPDRGLAFAGSGWDFESSVKLLPDESISNNKDSEYSRILKLHDEIMALAYSKLGAAKDWHDRLESAYSSHIDFNALTEFTEKALADIFG